MAVAAQAILAAFEEQPFVSNSVMFVIVVVAMLSSASRVKNASWPSETDHNVSG